MNSKKRRPKETTPDRQYRLMLEFDRLVALINESLEHRSPGLYGYLDRQLYEAQEALDEAAEIANDAVTLELERQRESFKTIDQSSVIEYERLQSEAEQAAIDAESERDAWLDMSLDDQRNAFKVIDDASMVEYDRLVDEGLLDVGQAGGKSDSWFTDVVNDTGAIINNISMRLGFGFDAAMITICTLPALLESFRDDLKGFFTFDNTEFIESMAKMAEVMKSKEVS